MKVLKNIILLNVFILIASLFYAFSYNSFFLIKLLALMTSGIILEVLISFIKKEKVRYYGLGSSFLAGALTCSVPPSMPFYMILLAVIISICLLKPYLPKIGIFLNGVIAARLLLMIFFPIEVSNWGNPIDGITSATPQEFYKFYNKPWEIIGWSSFLVGPITSSWVTDDGFVFCNIIPGSPGSNFPLLLIIFIGILAYNKMFNWRTGLSYALSFSLLNMLFNLNPIYNLITASSLFCIVFLFSDPYSTPSNNKGKWIFGIIIGLSNALIRKYGFLEVPYTEAIVYAILIGNLCKPILNKYFKTA